MTHVVIVRGTDPYKATFEALNLIVDEIRIPQAPVLLKPNLLLTKKSPLAVTNPQVCAAVADFISANKHISNIQIGEGTTGGENPDAFKSMENNGYLPYQDRWIPINLANDPPEKWFPIYNPGYPHPLELGIAKTVTDCPYIISIPKFKTHDVLGLTLSLKNLMGTLTAVRDAQTKQIIAQKTTNTCAYMHGFGNKKPDKMSDKENTGPSKVSLAINLIRLARTVHPSLAVIDGIEAMEGDGPASHGTKKNLGLIIAGTDFIAVDTVATYIAGMDPLHFQYIYQAGLLGLGEYRIDQIRIVGNQEPLNAITPPFRPHHLYQRAKFTENQISIVKNQLF